MELQTGGSEIAVGTSIIQIFREIGGRLFSLAFPRSCVVTGKPLENDDLETVSRDALENIWFLGKNACPACGMPCGDEICEFCGGKGIFDFKETRVCCVAAAETEITEIVHALKYRFVRAVARDMAEIARSAVGFYDFLEGAVLVPVPLWKKRFDWRGFNQSEFIARELAKNVPGTRVVPELLVRTRDTGTQTMLNEKRRRENVAGAFDIAAGTRLDPKTRYVLVDDVLTTGSTLGECVRALRQNGAAFVDVAVFARAISPKTKKNL